MAQASSKSAKSNEPEPAAEGVVPAPAGASEDVSTMPVYSGGTDGGGAPAPPGQSSNVASVPAGEAKDIAKENQVTALENEVQAAQARLDEAKASQEDIKK